MSKLTYRRLDDILELLIQQTDPIAISELSKINKVTARTIRTDINNLNEILQPIGADITMIRKWGYKLNISNKEIFNNWWQENLASSNSLLSSTEERRTLLLLILLKSNNPYNLDDFLNRLYISKNTFYSYLKTIRDELLPFGLKVTNRPNIGFIITGDEFAKRQAIVELLIGKDLQEYLTGFTEIELSLFDNIDLDRLKKIELAHFSELGLLDSDYYHKNMLTHFALGISRVMKQQLLNTFPKKIPKLINKAQKAMNEFALDIERTYELTLPVEEKNYLTYFLAANAPRLVKNNNEKINSQDIAETIVYKLLSRIKQTSNFDWTEDQLLIADLISHLKGFINRNIMDAGQTNPLLKTIKKTFPLAYDLCLTNLYELGKQYDIYFPKDEIGYIALHIAGAFERQSSNYSYKYQVVLVCGTGKAMSRIIEAKLKKIYNEQIQIVQRLSFVELQQTNLQAIDFVITTLPLEQLSIPYIYIDMTRLDTEIEKINTYIQKLEKQKETIKQLFDKRFFFYDLKGSKKQVLKIMCEQLEREEIVSKEFYSSIIEREKIQQTSIDQIMAIPHPMTLIAKESKLAVALIPEGINWGESTSVQFVFLFAIKKEDYEKTAEIYELLGDFLNNSYVQRKILKNGRFNYFLKQVKHL